MPSLPQAKSELCDRTLPDCFQSSWVTPYPYQHPVNFSFFTPLQYKTKQKSPKAFRKGGVSLRFSLVSNSLNILLWGEGAGNQTQGLAHTRHVLCQGAMSRTFVFLETGPCFVAQAGLSFTMYQRLALNLCCGS